MIIIAIVIIIIFSTIMNIIFITIMIVMIIGFMIIAIIMIIIITIIMIIIITIIKIIIITIIKIAIIMIIDNKIIIIVIKIVPPTGGWLHQLHIVKYLCRSLMINIIYSCRHAYHNSCDFHLLQFSSLHSCLLRLSSSWPQRWSLEIKRDRWSLPMNVSFSFGFIKISQ